MAKCRPTTIRFGALVSMEIEEEVPSPDVALMDNAPTLGEVRFVNSSSKVLSVQSGDLDALLELSVSLGMMMEEGGVEIFGGYQEPVLLCTDALCGNASKSSWHELALQARPGCPAPALIV